MKSASGQQGENKWQRKKKSEQEHKQQKIFSEYVRYFLPKTSN